MTRKIKDTSVEGNLYCKHFNYHCFASVVKPYSLHTVEGVVHTVAGVVITVVAVVQIVAGGVRTVLAIELGVCARCGPNRVTQKVQNMI